MKPFFVLAFVITSFTLVASQQDMKKTQVVGCLSKCEQDSDQWVKCAGDCVGVPLSGDQNETSQEAKECFHECEDEDGDCYEKCIGNHFQVDKLTKEPSITASTSSTVSIKKVKETPTMTSNSSKPTQISGRAQNASKTTKTTSNTTNANNRTPTGFVPQLNESYQSTASLLVFPMVLLLSLQISGLF
ncbi:hypothetical protein K7432_008249 [Basidiobolus ranarum]|uniref:Uncharacterized protein n=1 Tax=Basidiobolus ranarum TaxID=34480 RepID=A0ABR2VYV1_9FUNG